MQNPRVYLYPWWSLDVQCQSWLWISSWAYWSFVMSYRLGLGQCRIINILCTIWNLLMLLKDQGKAPQWGFGSVWRPMAHISLWWVRLWPRWPLEQVVPQHPSCLHRFPANISLGELHWQCFQAYKYIFTSPSSIEKEPKVTHSGNVRIHGMAQVTAPSIAYIATQVWSWDISTVSLLIANHDHRFVLHYHYQPSFLEQILSQTQKDFMTLCSICSRTSRSNRR